jgi:CheY-like chemotaxis protein
MHDDDDLITFIDDTLPSLPDPIRKWKVAIIDDDQAVHDGTRFALDDYSLNGAGIELLSAYSAREGQELLCAHPDLAVLLLDVVMETDDARLRLVEYIRQELKNDVVRIILRTGQPGQAPERRVIVDYDINDYKAKTELTADRLFTSLTAALRSYQQIQKMAETRRGLEIILDAASTLFHFTSMQRLAEGVLTQIASLLAVDCAGILVLRERQQAGAFAVLAGSGCYQDCVGSSGDAELSLSLRELIDTAFRNRTIEFHTGRSVLYIGTSLGAEVVVVLEAGRELSVTDRTLVEILCNRLSIAFDNVVLYERLRQANETLEHRVAQRTNELRAANERLEAQWLRTRQSNCLPA